MVKAQISNIDFSSLEKIGADQVDGEMVDIW